MSEKTGRESHSRPGGPAFAQTGLRPEPPGAQPKKNYCAGMPRRVDNLRCSKPKRKFWLIRYGCAKVENGMRHLKCSKESPCHTYLVG